MGLFAAFRDAVRQAFGLPPALPPLPPVLITPGTRAALNVHLMASASRANLLNRHADAAAVGDPFGGVLATVTHTRREALAGKLRRGEPVTVDEVVALANRDPSDPLNQAMLHAIFLQQDLGQPTPMVPHTGAVAGATADGPRRLL